MITHLSPKLAAMTPRDPPVDLPLGDRAGQWVGPGVAGLGTGLGTSLGPPKSSQSITDEGPARRSVSRSPRRPGSVTGRSLGGSIPRYGYTTT